MAPPPEYDKEPKAPDKSVTTVSNDDSKILYNIIKDQSINSDHKITTTGANSEGENKHVETLDDGQLRALLDEAITYKCPKDREGKSSLFKELLEEVEQDEQACEAAARGLGAGRGGRRGRGHREHHSSLQDLVAAMAGEAAPRRGRAHAHAHAHTAPPAASVSARALHGGSLPSGVDTSFLLSEDAGGIGCGPTRGGYLATVRCVNPPPLAERRVSAGDANPPEQALVSQAQDDTARRSKPSFPMTYTARATLEIGSGSVCSGRAVTTTTASNQVDSAIPFSCITTPEVVASCNTTSSTSQPTTAIDPKKSLDENGNAVQGFSSPLSGSSQLKKPRRKKSSKNETVIKSHQIDGYQGNKDLNEVLRFIESNAEGARGPKLGRVKHKDDSDDKGGKKRSTERRKDKESKMKRATSMEELSRTKLEDLTDKPALRTAKPRGSVAPAKPERRSWGDDARALLYRAPASTDPDPPALELTEFQTVTKKRKTRRRADDGERETDVAPRRTRLPSAEARARPSAPASAAPSDRSNDSNDDMDSVHSLPALAPVAPAPPPPPPHASYADIARTRHNIPDLIESCNFYAEGEAEPRSEGGSVPTGGAATPGGAQASEAEQYPALAARRAREKPPLPVVRAPRKERPETLTAVEPPAPAPDVVADRRPPVILLDSAARPGDMDGVTFGFDINEQLLGGSARRGARVDLLRDAPEHARAVAAPALLAVPVPVRACAALRYVPPDLPLDAAHLLQIVDYVGAAWEDVVRCGGGKVRYFSE
nr:actin cytoskeleton-regulatory complex protein pan1-like isoform X6 [Vanessa tameamea]